MKRKSAPLIPVAKGELKGYGANFMSTVRPGSMKILEAPSRYGSMLVYPNARSKQREGK